MTLIVAKEVAAMERMTTGELAEKYADVFGESTQSRNKQYMIKRIAWRMQANAEGGLSERALRRAAELANDSELRRNFPRGQKPTGGETVKTVRTSMRSTCVPMPGTHLNRTYKGRTISVTVLTDGFEFEGEHYKSLSAIAKVVTGSHWNGNLFFGLRKGTRS